MMYQLNTSLFVKFGRWYRLAIGVNAGTNWLKSLLHSSKARPLKKLMNSKDLIFKSDDFKMK
ncbi:hypothetical protein NHP190033_05100 [Helicobacter suis]|nr:hypothetical protein NHP190033_05100 [Helicobacter suis]